MRVLKSLLVVTVAAATLLLATACSDNKVNRQNYHLLDVGMRFNEVVHILGQPDWCDNFERPTECRWGDDNKNIHIIFVGRRVVSTSSTGLN